MAVLQILSEEELVEEHADDYLDRLYRIVCVGERPGTRDEPAALVRTTYVVDWEQLVHLLEDYTCFGEDIVEVNPLEPEQTRLFRAAHRPRGLARRRGVGIIESPASVPGGLPMPKKGSLLVICGPMFSGKSRELIRVVHIAEIASQRTALFKPRIDTRYSHTDISSHDGIRRHAYSVDTAREILTLVLTISPRPEVIAIDEGQFFDRGLTNACLWLVDQGFRVVVSGLDRNFRGEPFGSIPELLACADEVVKLRAVCMRCKDPRVTAVLPQRLIDGYPAPYDSPEVMVGGAESYEARCLDCHEVPGRPDITGVMQGMLVST